MFKKVVFLLLLMTFFNYSATFYVSKNQINTFNYFTSIKAGLAKLKAGDTLIIRPGVYNEALSLNTSGIEGQPIVINGDNGVLIKGARTINTTWIKDKSNVWKTPLVDSLNTGGIYLVDSSFNTIIPFKKVSSYNLLTTDSVFYFDATNKQLFIRTSIEPTKYHVEIPNCQTVIGVGGNNIVINNLRVLFNTGYNCGVFLSGKFNIVNYCKVEYMCYNGVYITGSYNQITNSVISHCGFMGLSGTGKNHLIYKDTCSYNNVERYSLDWSAGGAKLDPSFSNSIIMENVFCNNYSHGLWLDDGSSGNLIINNIAYSNYLAGIMVEISQKNIVMGNICYKNKAMPAGNYKFPNNPKDISEGFHTEYLDSTFRGLTGFGILLSTSPYTELYNNICFGNQSAGIFVTGGKRLKIPIDTPPDSLTTHDIILKNNISVNNSSTQLWFMKECPNSKSDYNCYSFCDKVFKLDYLNLKFSTIAEWEDSTHQDSNSVIFKSVEITDTSKGTIKIIDNVTTAPMGISKQIQWAYGTQSAYFSLGPKIGVYGVNGTINTGKSIIRVQSDDEGIYIVEDRNPPDNPCVLGGNSVDSAKIALFWKINTSKMMSFDSIGLWYNEAGFPVKAYDSGSIKVGTWNLKTTIDTITGLKADKLYYFSVFAKEKAGSWSETSDSAKVQIRTKKLSGKTSGNPVILKGSDAKLLFSDSLKIWGNELAIPYTDTIDHYDVLASNGFIISGPSFSFRNGNKQANVQVNFEIRTHTPAGPYSENDVRVYRFNINTRSWRLDTSKLTYDIPDHKLFFSTKELGYPFALMIDTLAPNLSVYTKDTAAHNITEPINDTFTIHDNIENPKVSLLAGPGAKAYSDTSYSVIPLHMDGSGEYFTTIPAYVADSASGLRSILIVSDGRSSDTINLSRKIVRIGSNCDDKKIPAMEWTPLSVTAKPIISALSEVFSRSLGVDNYNYDNRVQRIMQWVSTDPNSSSKDNWVEYSQDHPDIFNFGLGKTFWVKAKKDFTISFGNAIIPALIDTFEIVLKKGVWSDFSLPFNFDIYSGDIIDATTRKGVSADGIELYEWAKTENTYTTRALYLPGIEDASNPFSTFKANSVYTAYNREAHDVVLRIPPVCKSISMIDKEIKLAKSGSVSQQWSIRLGFKDDKGIELSPIYCSALPENKKPRYYEAAPTFTQTYARVANRINGKKFGNAASGDLSTGGTSFIISCENQSEQKSHIVASIEKITGLPQGMMAVLYYKGKKYDTAQMTSYNMELPAKQKNTGYLIVGSASYISGFINNLNLVFSFAPFIVNRVLRIRYTLPMDVKKVTTSIFDLKGRCVDHMVITEGLHAGEGVLTINRGFASGYYVIQMKVEIFGSAKPSVLSKRWVQVW